MVRFDPKLLYQALNERREARGLTWADVAREVGVSSSTLTRTARGGRMEADGMLAMCRWLSRPAESFVRQTRR